MGKSAIRKAALCFYTRYEWIAEIGDSHAMKDNNRDVFLATANLLFALLQKMQTSAQKFRRDAVILIDSYVMTVKCAGISKLNIQAIKMISVAFVDEWVGVNRPEWKLYWDQHSLQLYYFKKLDAGDKVYDFLQAILKYPERYQVCYIVFYFFLSFGYKGKYYFLSSQEYKNVIVTMKKQLISIFAHPTPYVPHNASLLLKKLYEMRYAKIGGGASIFLFLMYSGNVIYAHWYFSWLD